MSIPTSTPAAPDRYEAVRRVVEAELKGASLTRGRIRRWPKLDEAIPPDADPGPRTMPACRVEIQPGGPSRRVDFSGLQFRQASLIVRNWTDGPDDSAACELWSRIARVLEPSDEDQRDELDARLEAAGVWSLRAQRWGLVDGTVPGERVIESAGIFAVELWED